MHFCCNWRLETTDWPTIRKGFQPQTRNSEPLIGNPFWEVDRPTPAELNQQERPIPSTAPISQDQNVPISIEEGEFDSETDHEPSFLKIPIVKWARYVGVKSLHYVKIRHSSKIPAEEEKNYCDLEQAVQKTAKKMSQHIRNCC